MKRGPFEWLVGWRYMRARRRNQFLSFIALISMIGIALGVAALITVLSVMNGFQRELQARILGVTAHVELSGPQGKVEDWRPLAARGEREPGVAGAAPYVVAQGMLSAGGGVRGLKVRGIDPEREGKVSDIGRHMRAGTLAELRPGEYGIVIGIDLAYALRARLGDRLTLITPQGLVTPAGIIPRLRQFTVVGVFEVGMFEYDSGLALVHVADAQRLYRLGDAVSGVRLKLDDLMTARTIADRLAASLSSDPAIGAGATVTDWTKTHASFFRAVQVEKNVMFVILTLIVAVAAFNIVSTLVMAVADKRADIAILRTLGAAPASIRRIFMIQGSLIGIIGALIGLAVGIVLALNVGRIVPTIERVLGARFFDPNVYYITSLPSELRTTDVLTVAVIAFVLSIAATLYPSYRAAQINPAEALRYE